MLSFKAAFSCCWIVVLGLSACSGGSRSDHGAQPKPERIVRIARSKQLTALAMLEVHGQLEQALTPLGVAVQWADFPAGPQQFEAFNAGALDLTYTAESPPLFAQAARSPVVYLAATARNGALVSLLVPPNSPARSIADLKGKRIAFQRASIGHYLTIRALEQAGLSPADVTQVNLAPTDAIGALTKGDVDAWFIWEPFVTRAVSAGIGRVLLDGRELRDTTNFITVRREFAEQHPDVLRIYLEKLQAEEQWCAANKHEMAEQLSPRLGIDVAILERMHDRTKFGVFPITEHDRKKQQEVADMWLKYGFIPSGTDVQSGFLAADKYATLVPAALGDLTAAER
ncbi:MAG: aliphatic sulfonate ABC transporter substrate-binding protein [Polyangiales bacterium]